MTPAPQSARNISNTATVILSGLGVCCHRPKSSEMASAVHRFKTAPATAARPSFHDEGASAAALDAAIAPNPAANPDAPFFFYQALSFHPPAKALCSAQASLRMCDAADFSTALSGLATFATR